MGRFVNMGRVVADLVDLGASLDCLILLFFVNRVKNNCNYASYITVSDLIIEEKKLKILIIAGKVPLLKKR
ncbi:hypothetical protein AYI68_g6174 [Smittium mucronatum]|uniref:Uncharacterized protein n=1 Tax=Smittium mucronatum TaxID=133383 RepID=A0A1R0GSA5_9FUNG|nr:hypothetical protein AYI68_g6174 [Smittium mucronatum]